MKKIIETTNQAVAREAVQIAFLVWAALHNDDPRVHVYRLSNVLEG